MSEPTVFTSGIDRALQLAAAGSTRLEYADKPTLKDKKEARDYFKRASKILDSVVALEEEDVYETGPKPDPEPERPAPGVPLDFEGATPPPMPDEPEEARALPTLGYTDAEIVTDEPEDEFDSYTEEEREKNFGALLEKLENEGLAEGTLALSDWKAAEKVWRKAWKVDQKDTYRRITFAIYERNTIAWTIPMDEEMAPAPVFSDPMEGGEA